MKNNIKRYSMGQASATADRGTSDIIDFLYRLNSTTDVRNVEKDPVFQTEDIDLVWTRRKDNSEKDYKIEIKVDNYYKTGNYFFETLSNVEKGTPGCFLYSKADWLFYYFLSAELHVIELKVAQYWFLRRMKEFKKRQTSTPVGNGLYHTEGALVSRTVFAEEMSSSELMIFPFADGKINTRRLTPSPFPACSTC
ncbi:MAG: hypothetical protein ABIR13_09010 [Polaromonas sp.]